MSNSQINQKEVYESNNDTRQTYQAPQVLDISLVEGRVVLGVCKTGSMSQTGANTSNCMLSPSTPCNTIGTGS